MSLRQSFVQKLESVPAPARRGITVVWTLFQDLNRCDLMKQASAMAYVSLLSLIPSLVAVFCVLSLFSPLVAAGRGGGDLVAELRVFILNNLAASSGEAVVSYLDGMLSGLDLKSIGWSSFASVLVTLILLLRQIEEALNRIWLVNKGRNVFTRFMYFWTFMTLGVVVLAIILGVSSGFDIKRLLSLQEAAMTDDGPLGRIVGWVGAFAFFFFLYKVVPYCRVLARNAALGAAMSATMLSTASWAYGTFIIDSSNYKTLYGALAQLPLFLMWLYICWVIILLGAVLSWRLQEGFPRAAEEEPLDVVNSPAEALRNLQLKALMPLVGLVAIHRTFQQGSGRGLSAQDLAHALRVPVGWVADALDQLASLGYVVASRPRDAEAESAAAVTDPFFPSVPPESLRLGKLMTDLSRPADEWMARWEHELPLDVPQTVDALRKAAREAPGVTLAEALARLPAAQAV